MTVFLADITLMNLSSLAFWSDEKSEKANVLINFYLVLTMRMKDSFSNLACHCSFSNFLPTISRFLRKPHLDKLSHSWTRIESQRTACG